ncbi:MAG: tRNA (adenosine(37)-N6)-threonylcarbamoyltransferase complex ATPase subunit type 1 TsaE [Mycoplasma sp.]|nr:tRNA (adenosine(37)-N6)-threonylcarbamoyltransferase complex ATPase subunit type 1 TsaE [Mycoplasma sp.]
MKQKKSFIEFEKSLNEIDFIAQLIVNLTIDINERFIFLKGEIGSGKTTLVQAIANFLKEDKKVVSPSFNKMFVYDKFVHIDAYNMDGQNLEEFEDYFEDKLIIIEWPEKLSQKFDFGFQIEIIYVDDNKRKYIITWKE